MKDRIKAFIGVVSMIGISSIVITYMYIHEGKTLEASIDTTPIIIDTIPPEPKFMAQTPDEGLKAALEYYEIQCSDIVYAQAILETGYFKSAVCLNHNNLFGLYDSKKMEYYRFEHWSESVVAYKKWIQERYKPPEDYYNFLKRIHYASDPQYIDKLKKIVSKNK